MDSEQTTAAGSAGYGWRGRALEGLVIVASILLAFAIDAGWQERQERKSERVLLERLQADFVELKSALEVVREEHSWAEQSCLALLELSVGDSVPMTAEYDGGIGLVFIAARTFNPGIGAVGSLLAGEGARLIQNKQLSDLLMAWPGLVEELQEEEQNLQKGVAERWTPYLMSRGSIGPYVAVFGPDNFGLPTAVAAPEDRTPLVVDEAFLNNVLDRYKWQTVTLRDLVPVATAIDEILALIDAELSL